MPPPLAAVLPSKSHINRCGALLAQLAHADEPPEGYDVADRAEDALQVLRDFRAAHSYPMVKIRLGLRSMVRTEGADEVLAQRLKRVPRIVRKLHRMENSSLARLEDIGGCRAVLADGPELERVRARIMGNWKPDISRERDYIAEPKDIGYRAVHLVVKRDGRSIEVQLRTRGQQQWAEAVEAADARLGLNLKDGTGPAEMIEYFGMAGEIIYLGEYGYRPGPALIARFVNARESVVAAGYYSV